MEKRWELCIQHKGRRLDKELLRKITSENDAKKIRLTKSKINGIRICYNDKLVLKLKNKDIKEKKRQLKEEIKKENNLKLEFERIMKLKPKDYKNIPDKEKNEKKFNYMHQKAVREVLEEKITEINDMTPLEYLNILNDEVKEKLIGLCLNKQIFDAFEKDSCEEETKEGNDISDYDGTEEEEESNED